MPILSPSPDEATLFAALGERARLAMIARLCDDGPLPTVRLMQGAKLSRQAMTKHLKVLERAGLVRSERIGRDRSWRIEAARLAQIRASLDRFSAQWEARIERLRIMVEQGDA